MTARLKIRFRSSAGKSRSPVPSLGDVVVSVMVSIASRLSDSLSKISKCPQTGRLDGQRYLDCGYINAMCNSWMVAQYLEKEESVGWI